MNSQCLALTSHVSLSSFTVLFWNTPSLGDSHFLGIYRKEQRHGNDCKSWCCYSTLRRGYRWNMNWVFKGLNISFNVMKKSKVLLCLVEIFWEKDGLFSAGVWITILHRAILCNIAKQMVTWYNQKAIAYYYLCTLSCNNTGIDFRFTWLFTYSSGFFIINHV